MSTISPRDIEALLEAFEASTWSELELRVDGLELFVSKSPGARPALRATGSAPSAPSPTQSGADPAPSKLRAASGAADGLIAVRAPHLGTFYRAPKPGAPHYVKVGQRVEAGAEVCLIEVMKLFTSVTAGTAGVIKQVLVEDAELVEFDQALFLIESEA